VHLNPHFAGGTKDQDASRIFYEPLAGWDTEGNLIPALAAEIPSAKRRPVGRRQERHLEAQARRHLARRQALHRRRRGLHRGLCRRPGHGHGHDGHLQGHQGHKIDSHTVRVEYPKPTPFWAEALVGSVGMILPKHVFEPFMGAKSREARPT
jgi:peptide/nickel transport system substrate-binding protein